MGPLGIPELIFIFVLALLIFGPRKLPELGRTFGKSMAEFRRASNDLKSTFQREMDTIDRESQDLKDVADDVKQDLNTADYYDSFPDDYDSTSDRDQTSTTSSASSRPASPETVSSQSEDASTTGSPTVASTGNEILESSPSSEVPNSAETPDVKPGP